MKRVRIIVIYSLLLLPSLVLGQSCSREKENTTGKGKFYAFFNDSDGNNATNIRNTPKGKIIAKVQVKDRGYYSFKVVECKNKWFRIEGNIESSIPDEGVADINLKGKQAWVHSSVIGAGLIGSIDNPQLFSVPDKTSKVIEKIITPTYDIFIRFINMKDDWVLIQYIDEQNKKHKGWILTDWICSNPLTTCP